MIGNPRRLKVICPKNICIIGAEFIKDDEFKAISFPPLNFDK